jgi:hypothetical protein
MAGAPHAEQPPPGADIAARQQASQRSPSRTHVE